MERGKGRGREGEGREGERGRGRARGGASDPSWRAVRNVIEALRDGVRSPWVITANGPSRWVVRP